MKGILNSCVFVSFWLLAPSICNCQSWNWASTYNNTDLGSSSSLDKAESIFRDGNGAIYITGNSSYFTGGNCSNCYNSDLLYKFNSVGKLEWKKVLALIKPKLLVDQNGNSYVAGANSIIQKINSAGAIVWEKTIPRTSFYSITSDKKNGIIISGEVVQGSTSEVQPGMVLSGNCRFFLAFFDSDGNCKKLSESCDAWIYSLSYSDLGLYGFTGGSNGYRVLKFDHSGIELKRFSDSLPFISNLTVDASGNVLVLGEYNYQNPLKVNGVVYQTESSKSLFLIKYNNEGALQWMKEFSGEFMNGQVKTDDFGNIYVRAYYYRNPSYDGKVISVNTSSSSNFPGNFILKIDGDGQMLWFKKVEPNRPDGNATFTDFDIKSDGIILSGTVSKSAPPFDELTVMGDSYPDLLLVKLIEPENSGVEYSENPRLMIYPNPTSSKINIVGNHPALEGSFRLSLKDLSSKEIMSSAFYCNGSLNISLNTEFLSQGCYIIELNGLDSGYQERKKFVISR